MPKWVPDWVNDNREIVAVAVFGVVLIVIGIYALERDAEWWAAYRPSHHCTYSYSEPAYDTFTDGTSYHHNPVDVYMCDGGELVRR